MGPKNRPQIVLEGSPSGRIIQKEREENFYLVIFVNSFWEGDEEFLEFKVPMDHIFQILSLIVIAHGLINYFQFWGCFVAAHFQFWAILKPRQHGSWRRHMLSFPQDLFYSLVVEAFRAQSPSSLQPFPLNGWACVGLVCGVPCGVLAVVLTIFSECMWSFVMASV